jgi:hypothetical protein
VGSTGEDHATAAHRVVAIKISPMTLIQTRVKICSRDRNFTPLRASLSGSTGTSDGGTVELVSSQSECLLKHCSIEFYRIKGVRYANAATFLRSDEQQLHFAVFKPKREIKAKKEIFYFATPRGKLYHDPPD